MNNLTCPPPPAKKRRYITLDEQFPQVRVNLTSLLEQEAPQPQNQLNYHIGEVEELELNDEDEEFSEQIIEGSTLTFKGSVHVELHGQQNDRIIYTFPNLTLFDDITHVVFNDFKFKDTNGLLIGPNSDIIIPGNPTRISFLTIFMELTEWDPTSGFIWPPNLRELEIQSDDFGPKLDNLPHSVRAVFLNTEIQDINSLPPGITNLTATGYIDPVVNLPIELTHLHISAFSVNEYTVEGLLTSARTPNLYHLYLGGALTGPIGPLSQSLELLSIGDDDHSDYNEQLDLPSGLKVLDISNLCDWNHPITLPQGLTNFYASELFSQSIDEFPDTVETIILGEGYTHKINKIPASLENITVFPNYPYIQELKDLAGEDRVKVSNDYYKSFDLHTIWDLYEENEQED
jgi:hypothetical protein